MTMLIISLNIADYILIKDKYYQIEKIPNIYCLQQTHLKYEDIYIKDKRWMICCTNAD